MEGTKEQRFRNLFACSLVLYAYVTSVRDSGGQLWTAITIEGWLLGLVAIGNESCHEIRCKVGRTPVPRMLNVQQVLQLVNHCLHQRSTPQQDVIMQQQQAIRHVVPEVRHYAHPPRLEQGPRQRLGQVTCIAE